MVKYEETAIDNEILKVLQEKHNYSWDQTMSKDAVKMLLEGTAIYLGEVKSKKEVKACVLNDKSGNFIFGAFVRFIPNEEDETKGSYSLNYTFDEKDITKDMKQVTYKDPVLHHIISDTGLKFRLGFNSYEGQEFIVPVIGVCAQAIKDYMRANVNVDPKLELEDFFTATAEMEGDKVYVGITPSAVLKQHVKDDASTEEKAA